MKTLKHYIDIPFRWLIRIILSNERLSKYLSRHFLKQYLAMFYCNWVGFFPNFKRPRDLNESLLKLSLKNRKSDKRDTIVKCVDKYAVRQYVEEKGYGYTLNELIGVYEHVEDIDVDALPERFVMKMNNASGRNYICTDKSTVDWQKIIRQFSDWLKDTDFGLLSGEWQYSLIKPRIIIERFLENIGESSLIDYKFNCFNGEVLSCFVAYNRNPKDPHGEVCYDDYDLEWNRTERIKDDWHKKRKLIPRPKCLGEMIKMASDISKGFEYVRVDLYEIEERIMFGELTFTPQGCVLEFYKDIFLKEANKKMSL